MEGSEILFTPYPIGAVVGDRYRIVGELGRGGMGVVYAADDLKLAGKLRAIKVIAPLPGGRKYAEEAQVMMKVEHPNLPLIVDYFPPQHPEYEALVMEYIDGFTVAEIFRSNTSALSFSQIVDIGLQLCFALRYLHSLNSPIIHRDLKPSNVMIDKKGNVKLIDFGISRQYVTGKEKDTVQLGTLGFSAPEQGGTGQSDERTDIYGLGALLYFMACEGKIYRQKTGHAREYESITDWQPEVPEAFKIVLRRLLQADPNLRYRTIAEVELALSLFGQPKRDTHWTQNQQKNNSHAQKKQKVIGVLSLAPGAGATFLTHTLAIMLGRQGASVAAVEYDDTRPEWHAWLSGNKYISHHGAADRITQNKRYVHYKHDELAVDWYSLHPEQYSDFEYDEQRFAQMLSYLECVYQLIDFSGKWKEPNSLSILKQVHFVIVIGDPLVVKWQASDLKKLIDLKQEMFTTGGNLIFIANKDLPFHGRNEWLSLFPEKPTAIIPRLHEETLLSLQWRGRWATDESRLNKRLNKALLPILKLVYKEINTE